MICYWSFLSSSYQKLQLEHLHPYIVPNLERSRMCGIEQAPFKCGYLEVWRRLFRAWKVPINKRWQHVASFLYRNNYGDICLANLCLKISVICLEVFIASQGVGLGTKGTEIVDRSGIKLEEDFLPVKEWFAVRVVLEGKCLVYTCKVVPCFGIVTDSLHCLPETISL